MWLIVISDPNSVAVAKLNLINTRVEANVSEFIKQYLPAVATLLLAD